MSTSARALSENSKVQMTQVIVGLLEGHSPKEVAESTGVPHRRIMRWQKDPDFMALYEVTETELMLQIRSEASAHIKARLEMLGPDAVKVLQEGLQAEKMSDRLGAAKAILSFNGVGRSVATVTGNNVLPIEERIRKRVLDVSPTSGD